MQLPTIVKNAILGDGHIDVNHLSVGMTFISSDEQSLSLKERMVKETYGEELRTTYREVVSGFGGRKLVKSMYVQRIPLKDFKTNVSNVNIDEAIEQLTEFDLFLWYLDDGSWHIRRNTMHLYSNMLDEKQSNRLIEKVFEIYGVRPTLRVDRKKDGRSFYYLYFPRKLVNILQPIYKSYITALSLSNSYYKVGGEDYIDLPANESRRITKEEAKRILESTESSRKAAKTLGISRKTIMRIRSNPSKYVS